MFGYMLATLVIFAFAGTVLMVPAFTSDLVAFVEEGGLDDDGARDIRRIVGETSVIIPARNEELTLPALLESLEQQTLAPREIIVVDDQSEDRTAAVARRESTRVVAAGERPKAWLGKPWALHQGAAAADGRFLLFLDADVQLKPNALETLARALLALSGEGAEGAAAISVQPFHRTIRLWERLALFFNILVFVGAARRSRAVRLGMEDSCCFGPCIFCRRSDYDRFGGHAAVGGSVLEDMHLGSELRSAGTRVRSFSGRGVVEFRMYSTGLRALLDGFTKNVLLGARRSSVVFRVFAVFWFTGLLAVPAYIIVAAVSVALPELVVATVFYAFFVIQITAAGERLGKFGSFSALFFPVHVTVFLVVLVRAAILALAGRNVQWKGRPLDPASRS